MRETIDTSPSEVGLDGPAWTVRTASPADAGQIASAVGALLVEVGGVPPSPSEMEATARALIADERAGTVILAESQDAAVVGIVAVSWQMAIHVAGTYGLIQDLWVHPEWRGRAVGASLLAALRRTALTRGTTRIEVGLPRESFAGIRATEGFYRHNGFDSLGLRMRLRIAPS